MFVVCHDLFKASFVAQFVIVCGRSHGLKCDCLWLASGPMCDLFENVNT